MACNCRVLGLRAAVVLLLGSGFAAWIPSAAHGQFPPHVWSQRFGSDQKTCDEGHDVAADGHGNIFVTGFIEGTVDFGGGPLASAGNSDVFVAKYDAVGAHVWSKRFGDVGQYAKGYSVAVDAGGGVIVTGKFGGTVDFGGGPLAGEGSSDVFVVRFDADGNHLWSKRAGGQDVDFGTDVAVDGDQNVVVTGQFRAVVDFGGGAITSWGNHDVFLVKYDADGNHLWSRSYGGPSMDLSGGVVTDGDGDVFLVGSFQNTVDFGGGPLASAGYHDIFLVKIGADGGHMWSRHFGHTVNDLGHGVAVDQDGDVVVTGEFRGNVDFGGGLLTSAGNEDVFVAKFDASGRHLWSQRFGDEFFAQSGFDVAVGADDDIVVTGWFWGTIDMGGGILTSAGEKDIFVASYDASGSHLWSGRFGDTGWDAGFGVAADENGNTLLTGPFEVAVDFGGGSLVNPGGASFGCTDIYVVKFGPLSSWIEGPDRLASLQPGTFTAKVSGGVPPYSYEWFKQEKFEGAIWLPVGDDGPQVDAASMNVFYVKAVVTDAVGQTSIQTHRVYVPWKRPIPIRRGARGPKVHALEQNVPNPFNPTTTICFDLPVASHVSLVVYDVNGRMCSQLLNTHKEAGSHSVVFTANGLVSGIYFCRLVAGDYTAVKKMILAK